MGSGCRRRRTPPRQPVARRRRQQFTSKTKAQGWGVASLRLGQRPAASEALNQRSGLGLATVAQALGLATVNHWHDNVQALVSLSDTDGLRLLGGGRAR